MVCRPAPPVPHRYLPEGYAAGSTETEKWLIVWGSAYDGRLVYATEEAAEERAVWLREIAHSSTRDSVVVRYVRRCGDYYPITDAPQKG
jgi:hypothetical protein